MKRLLAYMPARLMATSRFTVWNFPWFERCRAYHVSISKGQKSVEPRTREPGQSRTFVFMEEAYFVIGDELCGEVRYNLLEHLEFIQSSVQGFLDSEIQVDIVAQPEEFVLKKLRTSLDIPDMPGAFQTAMMKQAARLTHLDAFIDDAALPYDTYLPSHVLSAPGVEIWLLRGDWEREQHLYIVLYFLSRTRDHVSAEVYSTHNIDENMRINIRFVIKHSLIPSAMSNGGEEIRFFCPDSGSYSYEGVMEMIAKSAAVNAVNNDDMFIEKTLTRQSDGIPDDLVFKPLCDKWMKLWAPGLNRDDV